MNLDVLTEQVKATRNLCEVSLILISLKREDLLPTVLELMQVECQQLVLENCVVEEVKEVDSDD